MPEIVQDKGLVRGLEKRKACDLCHIKKIRCDAQKPTCSHCVIYVAHCVYTPHIKKRKGEVKVQARSISNPPPQAVGTAPARPVVPLLHDLLPRLQDYFANLNSIVPLFSQTSFMRMVHENNLSSNPSPLVNAAINIVLALTYQQKATTLPPIPGFDQHSCVSNVESVVNSHDSRQDLLGLQVFLGLITVKFGTPQEGTVAYLSTLLGSAVKLSHRLGLNRSSTNNRFDAETALQRTRVFWLIYILDRHMTTISHDPPLQQDMDLDVQVPPPSLGYGLVRFTTQTGKQIDFDFLTSRIQLSRIQGVIYTRLYSIHASSQTPEVLQQSAKQICDMLGQWLTITMPPELYPDNLAGVSPPSAVRELIALYFNYIFCLMHTHKVGQHSAEWITRLVNYSQDIIQGSHPSQNLVQPSSGWNELVSAARDCARLFRAIEKDDMALMWATTCAYISAALVLIANALTVPEQTPSPQIEWETEEKLITEAVDHLARGVVEMPHAANVKRMANAFGELACRARIARAKFAFTGCQSSTSVLWLETEARKSAGFSALELIDTASQARVARLKLGLVGADGEARTTSASVEWFEAEARKSAGFSALELVQAFTMAEGEDMDTRLAAGGEL